MKIKITDIFIVLYIVFCIFFGSENVSADGYAYTYSAMTGTDILAAHHLLYTPFCRLVLFLFSSTGAEPLKIIQIMNACFAGLSVYLLSLIIRKFKKSEVFVIFAIAFAAFSFAVLRFATENECYVIPVFFSLWGLFFMQKYTDGKGIRYSVFAGTVMAVGCLFHQIVIIEWLCAAAFVLFRKQIRSFVAFLLPFVIVPVVYCIGVYYVNGSLGLTGVINFALHDYINGVAEPPSLVTILKLAPVSLIRTFFQMHGYVFTLFSRYTVVCVLVLVVTFFLLIAALRSLITLLCNNKKRCSGSDFAKLVLITLICNTLFALLSNANSEFMVILPFLAVILYSQYSNAVKPLLFLSLAMLVWNTAFGLIPYKNKNLKPYHQMVQFLHDGSDNVYLLSCKPEVENELLYLYGGSTDNIYYSLRFDNKTAELIKSSGKTLYTDLLSNKEVISRSSVTSKSLKSQTNGNEKQLELFSKSVKLTDSIAFESLSGTKTLYKTEF